MKYKLLVLYGQEACKWADEHSSYIRGAIKQIKSGKLFGGYQEFHFDTLHDREIAKNILEYSCGWENNVWQTWEE